MSTHEQAVASLLTNLAFSFDGAVLGFALAYAAVRSILRFTSNSSALRKLRSAPSVRVSDLRSVLADDSESSSSSSSSGNESEISTSSKGEIVGRLVIVRGVVEAKSAVDGNWKSLRPNVLVSQESGDKAVIIQRTQTVCISLCMQCLMKCLVVFVCLRVLNGL